MSNECEAGAATEQPSARPKIRLNMAGSEEACRKIRQIVTPEFLHDILSQYGGSNPVLVQAFVLCRHLTPGRSDQALFAHDAIRRYLADFITTAGLMPEPEWGTVLNEIFNYLDGILAWDYDDDRWVPLADQFAKLGIPAEVQSEAEAVLEMEQRKKVAA